MPVCLSLVLSNTELFPLLKCNIYPFTSSTLLFLVILSNYSCPPFTLFYLKNSCLSLKALPQSQPFFDHSLESSYI